MLALNQIHHGDCRLLMPEIETGSIDMIFADLPYGTTANKWDSILPMQDYYPAKKGNLTQSEYLLACYKNGIPREKAERIWAEKSKPGLWAYYQRIVKPGGAIVLTAAQPFTALVVASNLPAFKYSWIWKKSKVTAPLLAKKRPLRQHEDVLVFEADYRNYNPQGLVRLPPGAKLGGNSKTSKNYSGVVGDGYQQEFTNYPRSVLDIKSVAKGFHPTQKPEELVEYFISSYTQPGQIVLDNCAGSCTTAVAAENTGRQWICIENELEYVKKGNARVIESRIKNSQNA